MAVISITWGTVLRILIVLLVLATVSIAFFPLPFEKALKNLLLWIKLDLGLWGPVALAFTYIPLAILGIPTSILTLGGGYLYGMHIGFVADTVGATMGATAAFIIGRTIGRPYVVSKLKGCVKFQAAALAIQISGFKIVFLLRLFPIIPFNMLNYLLSLTPINTVEFMLGTWLGMMPLTLALVYVGSNLKDLSDVTHGWNETSLTHLISLERMAMALGFVISVILIICVTKVAKASLDKALMENAEKGILTPSLLPPIVTESSFDLHKLLMIKVEPKIDKDEKQTPG